MVDDIEAGIGDNFERFAVAAGGCLDRDDICEPVSLNVHPQRVDSAGGFDRQHFSAIRLPSGPERKDPHIGADIDDIVGRSDLKTGMVIPPLGEDFVDNIPRSAQLLSR